MNNKQAEKVSKLMSLVLRHKPEAIGIELDEHGWADVTSLLQGLYRQGYDLCRGDIEYIVRTDSKQRYSFNETGNLIRANQGHSIQVDVELEKCVPPDELYHGTGIKYVKPIKQQGIKHMSRLYVHLSDNKDTAFNVGKRHGKPVVFVIDTKQMVADNVSFYKSANGVWLTDYVDTKYIKGGIST